MKKILLLSLFISTASFLFGQTAVIKKVTYAKTVMEVPADYVANDEYSLENNFFSAQWLYLTNEMVEQGVNKQILMQFENQIEYSNASDVAFISNGGTFSGKKYALKNNKKFNYRILAFGKVDEQPLVLNMAFKEDPISNEKMDELMKRFILLKK